MKNLILYSTIFLVLLLVFFVDWGNHSPYPPIPAGLLYSSYISSKTIVSEQVTDTILYKAKHVDAGLPTLLIYSELNIPNNFIGKKVDKKNSDYVVSLPTTKQKSFINPSQKETASKTITKTVTPTAPVDYTVEKQETELVFNFNTLNNIIKKADKTYFFSGKENTINDVTVRIYSTTPWQEKNIVKFKVINSQQKYFFIANVSLYEQQQLIAAEIYNEPLVAPEKTGEFIVLLPIQKQKQITLKLTESGDKGRVFSIAFDIP
ncbi:MAG: hypothetical protein PHE88_11975 [Elusimicrobia bacterium]|nr:hypothetical protein [Elusimicrobiota bacterium]